MALFQAKNKTLSIIYRIELQSLKVKTKSLTSNLLILNQSYQTWAIKQFEF